MPKLQNFWCNHFGECSVISEWIGCRYEPEIYMRQILKIFFNLQNNAIFILDIFLLENTAIILKIHLDWCNGVFYDGLVVSPCSPRDSQESSPTPHFKSINSLVLSFLYSPTLASIHDYWKNHSFDQTDLCWRSNVSAS